MIAMLDPDGKDVFLAGARREIEEHKLMMVDQHAGYTAFLDDLLRDVVAEAKRRILTLAERTLHLPLGRGDQGVPYDLGRGGGGARTCQRSTIRWLACE